jgi:prepilin-type N-terminal cleavage/methylation domain-containing protein
MKSQKGFTLIELMVVVSILAIFLIMGLQLLGTGSSGVPLYAWRSCTIDLPPGRAFEQLVSTTPITFTTKVRGVESPVQTTECNIPGIFYSTTIRFQEH